jgi:hypothetical protein
MLHAAVKQSRPTKRRPRHTRSGTALPRSDGRTIASRRFRQLVEEFEKELGGGGELSEVDRSLVRQAANLVQLNERISADVAAGAQVDADALVRVSSEMRRVLSVIRAKATKRKPDAPSLQDYLAAKAALADEAEDS